MPPDASSPDTIALDDFIAELHRYFAVGDLRDETARGLYERWRTLARDPARVRGLRDLLRGDTMEIAHGDAWFEQLGDRDLASDVELVRLVLATDATMTAVPPARPHCPAWLVGRWRLEAISEDGRTFTPPPRAQDWVLRGDGAIEAPGDPVDGGRWGLHEAAPAELIVRERGAPRRRRWLIAGRDGDRVDLIPPGSTQRTWRRQRVAGA